MCNLHPGAAFLEHLYLSTEKVAAAIPLGRLTLDWRKGEPREGRAALDHARPRLRPAPGDPWRRGEERGDEFGSGYLKGLSVLFQANNITDGRYVRPCDAPSDEIENIKYGRNYYFGLNYRL